MLVFATFCWSGNFIVGKFAYLYEVPPLTLNFFRWISVWLILIPFTYKEIFNNWNYIKKNLIVISFMGIMTISTFNSVVYFALNFTQVINVALVLAAIPAVTIIISSSMKVDKTNAFQLIGLLLSIIGISAIISNADLSKILSLNFNKGDLWMLVCVICWSLYSTLLKKHSFKFSQFTLIQLMVSVGILFLIPQFFYEKSIGLETNFNIPFFYNPFLCCNVPCFSCLLLLAEGHRDSGSKSCYNVHPINATTKRSASNFDISRDI